MNCGAMLNAYPDSMGGSLRAAAALLSGPDFRDAFRSFYILPSLFTTDLDRGFSVISYELNGTLAAEHDLDALKALGLDLKLDFILNHLSIQCPQFRDLLKNGDRSAYRDFFIDWNRFWEGKGKLTEEGYIRPDPEYIRDMFFRKPGLPILMVRFPDGRDVPYWNTFYQEVRTDPDTGERSYLGQMDVNVRSEAVWKYYAEVLDCLKAYGASIVRLDAFGYASKIPGRRNFMNDPETWELLDRVRGLADERGLTLLPEIHAAYGEGSYETLTAKGYMTYDFFLPGLIIDALENHDGAYLKRWAEEQKAKGIRCVTMLGCHDGIPLLDLKGLVPEDRIQQLTDLIVQRGGLIKNLHGRKDLYYQVNATYYSALGEDDRKLLLARCLQLFMPGKPQIWYLDLFAGKNDRKAAEQGGEAGHKEINRTNLTAEDIRSRLSLPVVQKQLELLRMRNLCEAFGFDADLRIDCLSGHLLHIRWEQAGRTAELEADLDTYAFSVRADLPEGPFVFRQE